MNLNEVDINDTDEIGWTPLNWAMELNREDVVRFLLTQPELKLDRRGGNTSTTALIKACRLDNVSVIRLVCQDERCTPDVINMKNLSVLIVSF